MSRADVHRVADMLMATEEIASIVLRGRSEFEGDVVLRRAVERCLEITGKFRGIAQALKRGGANGVASILWRIEIGAATKDNNCIC